MFIHKTFSQIAFEIEVLMSISECMKTSSIIFVIHSSISIINPNKLRNFGYHIEMIICL